MTQTPRDIANLAEGMVITMPQRILALLLQVAVSDASAQDKTALAFVDDAMGFMEETFATEFEVASRAKLPDPLREALEVLTNSISEVQAALHSALTDHEDRVLAHAGTLASDDLTPAVSAFLGALFDAVVAHEKSMARRMKDTDSSALSQIDDIARTINFIAINASVEAARVGDAGKGFAVIATQIRELSQKSAEAVDRIRSELA